MCGDARQLCVVPLLHEVDRRDLLRTRQEPQGELLECFVDVTCRDTLAGCRHVVTSRRYGRRE